MKPHKHAKVIKAWAGGAEIEVLSYNKKWVNPESNERWLPPTFFEDNEYRIKPDCEYAYQEIFKLGGDDAVVLYEQFLDDINQLEVFDTFCEVEKWRTMEPPVKDPLSEFTLDWTMFSGKIRKKKQTVTEVLWVATIGGVFNSNEFRWCLEGVEPPKTGIHTFHKVPTCTREIAI